MDPEALIAFDNECEDYIEAITHDGVPPSTTHATPHRFVALDGNAYWVKPRAQNGLVSELVGGRLAHMTTAGPVARVIAVPPGLFDNDQNYIGTHVGFLDVHGTVNTKKIEPMVKDGGFSLSKVDSRSWARVVVFRSWLGVGDPQALVRLTDGTVHAIDFGDAFGNLSAALSPSLANLAIAGSQLDISGNARYLRSTAVQISQIDDEEILRAVSCVPDDTHWNSEFGRRLQIAEWLAVRRDALREAVESWILQ